MCIGIHLAFIIIMCVKWKRKKKKSNALNLRLKCHLYCDKRRSWNWAKKMRQPVEDWESHRPWLPIVADPISRQRPHRSPAPYPLALTSCWTVHHLLLLRPITAAPPLLQPAPSSSSNNISSALQQPIEELRWLPAIRRPHGPSSASRFDSRGRFCVLRKRKQRKEWHADCVPFFGADGRREVGGTSRRYGGGVCCRIDDARLAGLLAILLSLSLLGISFFFRIWCCVLQFTQKIRDWNHAKTRGCLLTKDQDGSSLETLTF